MAMTPHGREGCFTLAPRKANLRAFFQRAVIHGSQAGFA